MQIDSVEQGAGDARLIVSGASRRPAAGQRGIAEVTASAGVHRGDQLDPCWKCDVRVRPGDADVSGFERLPQRIEHRPLELGQLVEEQHAEVGEANLARTDAQAAADESGHRRAVVGRTKGPAPLDPAAVELSRDGCDHRNLERFRRLERRKNPGEAGGEQGLPGARRSAHQQVMAARRRDLERSLGDLLPLHLRQIRPALGGFRLRWLRRLDQRRALEMGEECEAVLGGGGLGGGGADLLHLDVMDGHFVPNLTMGPALCRSLRKRFPKVCLDVHVMISDPAKFIRIHRSTILRRDCIRGLRHDGLGVWSIELDDGDALRIGRTYMAKVKAMAGR